MKQSSSTPSGHRRQAERGQALGLASRRPGGRGAQGAGRAQRPRPGARRRRDHGLRHAGRRAGAQHRPQRRARRRLARSRCRPPPIDRQCGSSQQAAHFAAQGVIAGAYDIVIAAGVEVMSPVPMGASHGRRQVGFPFGPQGRRALRDASAGWCRQGISAELIADKWGLSPRGPRRVRRRSQQRAAAGHRRGPLRERDHARSGRRPGRRARPARS